MYNLHPLHFSGSYMYNLHPLHFSNLSQSLSFPLSSTTIMIARWPLWGPPSAVVSQFIHFLWFFQTFNKAQPLLLSSSYEQLFLQGKYIFSDTFTACPFQKFTCILYIPKSHNIYKCLWIISGIVLPHKQVNPPMISY